jgi:hypothetical protein
LCKVSLYCLLKAYTIQTFLPNDVSDLFPSDRPPKVSNVPEHELHLLFFLDFF